MKKQVTKKVYKMTLEEQIDSLARIVVSGFEQVDKRFEQVEKRFNQIDGKFQSIDSQLISIHQQLHNHTKRLEKIERQQLNTLEALDESVHRTEFRGLTRRVEVLESKK